MNQKWYFISIRKYYNINDICTMYVYTYIYTIHLMFKKWKNSMSKYIYICIINTHVYMTQFFSFVVAQNALKWNLSYILLRYNFKMIMNEWRMKTVRNEMFFEMWIWKKKKKRKKDVNIWGEKNTYEVKKKRTLMSLIDVTYTHVISIYMLYLYIFI